MKNIFYFILLFSTYSFSQNKDYYVFTNDAELNIIKGDFDIALAKYNKAFSMGIDNKVVDLVNALKCSCLLKKYDSLFLIESLLKKGLDFNKLEKDKVLKKCLKKYKYNNLDFTLSIDEKYKSIINKLDEKDQLYRKKSNAYTKYKNEIDSIDKENINSLLKLIEQNGFPSETKIGVENINGYQGWKIVIWHYHQKRSTIKNTPDKFSNKLKKALIKNQITPLEYSTLIELQNDSTYLKYKTYPIIYIRKREPRILKSTLLKKEQINKWRQNIGLYSLEDFLKKIIYQRRNKYDFHFGINNGYFDLSSQSKNLKKKIKVRSVKLNCKQL